MAEHLVAKALKSRAEHIRSVMPLSSHDEPIQHIMGWVAAQFEALASDIQDLSHYGPGGLPKGIDSMIPFGTLPEADFEKLTGQKPAEPAPVTVQRGETLRIRRPVGISPAGGSAGNTHVATVSGAYGGGGGGGGSWMPSLTVSADRVERAAKAAYTRMAERGTARVWNEADITPSLVILQWEHLDHRDRANWRQAVEDALRAALEADHG